MSAGEGFPNADQLSGLTAYDPNGDKIGSVEQVYRDDRTGQPEWVTVKTGLFGTKESFVPLAGARRDGDELHMAHDKDVVKEAPRLDADQHIDREQEQELYAHYGLTNDPSDQGAAGMPGAMGAAGAAGRDAAMSDPGRGKAGMGGGDKDRGVAGRDAAMPDTAYAKPGMGRGDNDRARGKDGLVRSEEKLHVSVEEREVGRARLRKIVTTEDVTTTVPVSHEEVRVVREPIAEGDRARADIGGADTETETEVILHAERPVVRKEAVAVERVRLETDKVAEEREVSDTVRKEEIQYDDGTTKGDDGIGGKHRRGERGGPRH